MVNDNIWELNYSSLPFHQVHSFWQEMTMCYICNQTWPSAFMYKDLKYFPQEATACPRCYKVYENELQACRLCNELYPKAQIRANKGYCSLTAKCSTPSCGKLVCCNAGDTLTFTGNNQTNRYCKPCWNQHIKVCPSCGISVHENNNPRWVEAVKNKQVLLCSRCTCMWTRTQKNK